MNSASIELIPPSQLDELSRGVAVMQKHGGPQQKALMIEEYGKHLCLEDRLSFIALSYVFHCVGSGIAALKLLKGTYGPPASAGDLAEVGLPVDGVERRRAMLGRNKRSAAIQSSLEWGRSGAFERMLTECQGDYTSGFRVASEIYTFGEYITNKFAQGIRRGTDWRGECNTVHAHAPGRHFIRKSFAGLYQNDQFLTDPDLCEEAARQISGHIAGLGITLEMEQVECLVCEFRQAQSGKKYLVNENDRELENALKIQDILGRQYTDDLFALREAVFDDCVLGEKRSWRGVREVLQPLQKNEGLIWDDFEHDYERYSMLL